jgi:hypothetical protein
MMNTRCEPIRHGSGGGRRIYSLSLPRLADWPRELDLGSQHFGLFLALDARNMPVDEIVSAADRSQKSGMVLFMAQGADSERVEQIFRQVHVARSLESGVSSRIVTVACANETVDQGLARFLQMAQPEPEFRATCGACLVARVGAGSAFTRLCDFDMDLERPLRDHRTIEEH